MNRDHLFEKCDYCLYCKDIDSNTPSSFEPCYVTKNQKRPFEDVEIKIIKTEEEIKIAWDKLILIKSTPRYEMEIMYNSSSEKGGSVNLTTNNGVCLNAAFYFDNEREKRIAIENAKTFSQINMKRKYRFFLGDIEGWGHEMYREVIITTSASKRDIEDIIKRIPCYFEKYQIFDIVGQNSKDVKMVMNEREDNTIPKEFMSLLIKNIPNFNNSVGVWDEDLNGFGVSEDEVIYIIEKIFNYVAEKLGYPSLELGDDKPVDIHTNCCYGLF